MGHRASTRHRRGRALTRRYGRAARRGRIEFGRGIVPAATIHLTPGHIYAMGASSSPKLIVVDAVTDDVILYRNHSKYGDQGPVRIERWIGEDLIAQGEATFKSQYGVSPNAWINMSEQERRVQLKGRL